MKFPKQVEDLIESAIADGVLTADERAALLKRCLLSGVDPKTLEMELDRRLAEKKKSMPPVPPIPQTQSAADKSKAQTSVHALDDLIKEYLTDGIISEKERAVLLKKAEELGIDKDEMDLYIDAQQQKTDQAVDAATNKRRGKTCPFCGGSIPALTDKCPHCGASITPEASAELQEILNQLENALVKYKAGGLNGKAYVEKYIHKAKTYYGNNPKVQRIVEEVTIEMKQREKTLNKTLVISIVGFLFVGILLPFVMSKHYSDDDSETETQVNKESISEDTATERQAFNGSSDQNESQIVTDFVNSGDLSGAKAYLMAIDIPDSIIGTQKVLQKYDGLYLTVINAFIKDDDLDGAEELALVWKSKVGDLYWQDSSCYNLLKTKFKEEGKDFSSLKSKYDEDDDD